MITQLAQPHCGLDLKGTYVAVSTVPCIALLDSCTQVVENCDKWIILDHTHACGIQLRTDSHIFSILSIYV